MTEETRYHNVTELVPTKPDAEVAKELRDVIVKAYEPLLIELNKAHKMGFVVNVSCGLGPLGKISIQQLQIMKNFDLS